MPRSKCHAPGLAILGTAIAEIVGQNGGPSPHPEAVAPPGVESRTVVKLARSASQPFRRGIPRGVQPGQPVVARSVRHSETIRQSLGTRRKNPDTGLYRPQFSFPKFRFHLMQTRDRVIESRIMNPCACQVIQIGITDDVSR